MNSDDLLDMAGSPHFISGIYNYCDRWCEHRSHSHRPLHRRLGRAAARLSRAPGGHAGDAGPA